MRQSILYMSVIFLLFSSCEEEYTANLDEVDNLLSIQALITNNASENVVKVMRTHPFYDIQDDDFVAGAKVELLDGNGNSYTGAEISEGIFKINHSAVVGKIYKIKVEAEGEVYESEFEQLPAKPTYNSFYVKPETAVSYKYSSTGKAIEKKVSGMRAFINVPVTDSLKYHRFAIDKVFEWVLLKDTVRKDVRIYGNDTIVEYIPCILPINCWRTSSDGGLFNIIGPTGYGDEKMIKDRPLTFAGNQILDYVSRDPQYVSEYLAG